jgi:hypothetical protein
MSNSLVKVKKFKIRTLSTPYPGQFHTIFSDCTGVTQSSEYCRQEAIRNIDSITQLILTAGE